MFSLSQTKQRCKLFTALKSHNSKQLELKLNICHQVGRRTPIRFPWMSHDHWNIQYMHRQESSALLMEFLTLLVQWGLPWEITAAPYYSSSAFDRAPMKHWLWYVLSTKRRPFSAFDEPIPTHRSQIRLKIEGPENVYMKMSYVHG